VQEAEQARLQVAFSSQKSTLAASQASSSAAEVRAENRSGGCATRHYVSATEQMRVA